MPCDEHCLWDPDTLMIVCEVSFSFGRFYAPLLERDWKEIEDNRICGFEYHEEISWNLTNIS